MVQVTVEDVSQTGAGSERRARVPALAARMVEKQFGQVRALRGVSFEAMAGEVTALIGDNGAGKSTLVKCFSGVHRPDAGTIEVDGKPVNLASPTDAEKRGIETVYQDLALAPHLDPVQNMYLGRELRRQGLGGALGFMKTKDMAAASRAAFDDLGATVRSLTSPVGEMSGGQRQAIAIARAVHWASRVVFLDEPTAALGVRQTKNVLDTIRRVSDKGIAVVFISHSMPHVIDVSDRIQVLRLGTRVANINAADTSMEELVGLMTGAVTKETQP